MSIKIRAICIAFSIIPLFLSKKSEAQNWKLLRYEIHGGVSTCNYFGDIGGSVSKQNWFGIKDIEVFSSRPSLYFGGRYYIKERIALQATFFTGVAHGSDKNSRNESRGYEFTTAFMLPRVNIEYTLFKINDLFGGRKYSFLGYSKPMNKTFLLYLTAGAGFSFYNININDKMQADRIPLDTLSNSPYHINTNKTSAFTWNAGLGMKYFVIKPLAVSASLEYTSMFSDNFDGYSTFTKINDLYWMVTFGLNYRLPTNEWGEITFKKKRKVENTAGN